MKSSCVLLIFASVLVVGCAGSSPLAPDSVSGSSARSSASARLPLSRSFRRSTRWGSRARPMHRGSAPVRLGARMDIEFAEVAGATAYEIEIVGYTGVKSSSGSSGARVSSRVVWDPGLYRIRVRTINCGGVGNWSADFFHSLDDNTPTAAVKPPQPPTPGPQCMDEGCAPPTPGPQCMVEGCEPPPPCMDECGPSDYLRRCATAIEEHARATVSARAYSSARGTDPAFTHCCRAAFALLTAQKHLSPHRAAHQRVNRRASCSS